MFPETEAQEQLLLGKDLFPNGVETVNTWLKFKCSGHPSRVLSTLPYHQPSLSLAEGNFKE
jgi:hypothetical protein